MDLSCENARDEVPKGTYYWPAKRTPKIGLMLAEPHQKKGRGEPIRNCMMMQPLPLKAGTHEFLVFVTRELPQNY